MTFDNLAKKKKGRGGLCPLTDIKRTIRLTNTPYCDIVLSVCFLKLIISINNYNYAGCFWGSFHE